MSNGFKPSLLVNRRLRINRHKCTHVKRSILGSGKLLVQKNDDVRPYDIIGKAAVSGGFSALNIAKSLGVNPRDGLQYLQKPLGSKIYKGELLLFKQGLLGKKVVTSPTDSVIESYNQATGELRLKFIAKEVPVPAGVYGIVDEVDQISGEVLIRAMVDEVFGILGSGRERGGILTILGNQHSLIQRSQITAGLSQHILAAGSLIYGQALREAVSLGVYGLITGGLNASDCRALMGCLDPVKKIGTDVGISVMATEGYGPIPIGEDIYELLKSYDQKYIFLDGNMARLLLPSDNSESILTLRKIALPIKKVVSFPHLDAEEVKVGNKIRIIWPPFAGIQGTVIGVDKTATVLESGIPTFMLTIETAKQKIKVPYPNVELIN